MSQTLEYVTPASTGAKFDLREVWRKLGPFVGLAFVFLLFAALRPKTFLSTINLQIMMLQTAVVGTAALGMTIIIIAAGIDLSVGSVVALSTVAIAVLLNVGVPPAIAAAGGVAVGIASGFITGNLIVGQVGRAVALVLAAELAMGLSSMHAATAVMWTVPLVVLFGGILVNELLLKRLEFSDHLGLVPFIATLVMMGYLRGMAHELGDNGTIVVRGDMWLKKLLVILGPGQTWMIFPPGVWLMLVLAAAIAFMLKYTQFGRHIFAVGSNEKTARLCGVNVERTKLMVYMLGVGFAGLAGVLEFSYLRMGDSTTAQGLELNIIAAVVIGGASLSGGEGSVVGSIIGALIMTVIANGCTKVGLDSAKQERITGGIIGIAVILDRLRHRKGS